MRQLFPKLRLRAHLIASRSSVVLDLTFAMTTRERYCSECQIHHTSRLAENHRQFTIGEDAIGIREHASGKHAESAPGSSRNRVPSNVAINGWETIRLSAKRALTK